jgi:hypothetical protein
MRTPQQYLTPRRNARLQARISFDYREQPCIVKSVGEREARIEVASVAALPNQFDLLLPGHAPHHCRVLWRALKEVGVSYRVD